MSIASTSLAPMKAIQLAPPSVADSALYPGLPVFIDHATSAAVRLPKSWSSGPEWKGMSGFKTIVSFERSSASTQLSTTWFTASPAASVRNNFSVTDCPVNIPPEESPGIPEPLNSSPPRTITVPAADEGAGAGSTAPGAAGKGSP